ncbi:MAG: hypothetical protein M1582_04780 [Actinobacteria bacterium]|nr:hypothetical protein [Actinomycetota bacterium]
MSAQVEEMVAQARELSQMAEQLRTAVSQFRTDEDETKVVMRRREADWGDQRPEGQPRAGSALRKAPVA